jgi:hypothetical protein
VAKQNGFNILNLVGELDEALMTYLNQLEVKLMDRSECENYEELDFILVASEEEAITASKDFNTDDHDITIICLGSVKEMKPFLLHNGRLVIDPEMAQSDLGKLILSRYFKQNYDVHLDESYSALFEKTDDIKITNHLSAGYYIDEVAVDAFDKGFNIVSLRSFLDHTVYYFTYLKQAGLAGIPYEIEYAANSDVFAINVHVAVRNFVAEYMIDSFGSVNSKDPLQYLLGVISRSCDFLEMTHVENPGKLVLTAFWNKGGKKKLSGLSFNNINTTAQTLKQLERKVKEYEGQDIEEVQLDGQQQLMKSRSLPGGILEMVVNPDENSILNRKPEEASSLVAFVVGKFEEEDPNRTINDITEEEFIQIVDGYPDDELIESLTVEDKEHLLDRVQKQNITEAYDEEMQRVRDNLADEDDYKKELTETMSEEVANRVAGYMDADILNKILGNKDEDEFKQVVKGGKEAADNFVATISGMDKEKDGDFIKTFTNNVKQKASKMVLKSSASAADIKKNINKMVAQTMKEMEADVSVDPYLKSFVQGKIPDVIEQNLDRYADKMGQTLESLNEVQMAEFAESEMPELVETVLNEEDYIEDFKNSLLNQDEIVIKGDSAFDNMSPEFQDKFKEKLEENLEKIDFVEKVDDKFIVTDDQVSEDQMQQIVKASMKDAFEEEFALEKATREEIEVKEKQIIEDLSATLNMEEEKVQDIVKGGTEKAKDKELENVVNNIFKNQPGEEQAAVVVKDNKVEVVEEAITVKESEKDQTEASNEDEKQVVEEPKKEQQAPSTLAENALIKKLKTAEEANKRMLDQLKAMELKLKAVGESDKKVQEIDKAAKKEAEEKVKEAAKAIENAGIMDEESKKETIEALKEGKLSDEDAKKLASALEREAEILNVAKGAEASVKKLQIEMQQKEAKFKSEMERANKTLKAKDLVVEKAKASMKTLVTKKEAEKRELAVQVKELNKRLADDKSTQLVSQVKQLKAENEAIVRSQDVYKKKVEIMSKKMNEAKKNDDSKRLQEENRALSRVKNQLENQLASETKNRKSLEERYDKAKASEQRINSQYVELKSSIKEYEGQIKTLKDNQARMANQAGQAAKAADDKALKELEQAKQQNTTLQSKMKELTEKLKTLEAEKDSDAQTAAPAGGREKKLEQDNKRLQTEIAKSKSAAAEQKKDYMKMKGENTGLKNQIKTLKRELEKAKSGGKGKKKAA